MKNIFLSLIIIFSFTSVQTSIVHPLKLPDTGQTGNYTSTFGEDSDYLINAPSFSDNGDGTITDNISDLMWQKIRLKSSWPSILPRLDRIKTIRLARKSVKHPCLPPIRRRYSIHLRVMSVPNVG